MEQKESVLSKALEGMKVLDLSGALGNYAGKLFAELGADVVLVEPPGGSELRHRPPFIGNEQGLERSLYFAYCNTSKRGISLDLDSEAGQIAFRELSRDVDLVIETGRPGVMAARGLAYADLCSENPRLVMLSVTPFGQTGPYAQYKAEDIVALAMGGMLYMGGYPDTAPMRVHGDQGVFAANLFGAVAAMVALLSAEVSGVGEHVDVSLQESVVMGLENAVQFYDLEGTIRKRWAGEQRFAGTGVYPCKDGYVFLMAGGIGANRFWQRTLDWFSDEGMEGLEELRSSAWESAEHLSTPEAKRTFNDVFERWAASKTKAELYHAGQARRIPIAPVAAPADMLESKQLESRGYFAAVKLPDISEPVLMAGAPYKLSGTPWSVTSSAPLFDQDTEALLGDAATADPREEEVSQ